MSTKSEATIADLYRVPEDGKAEIVNGELVLMPPTGGVPGRAAGSIYVELHAYEKSADYFAAGTLVVWNVDVLREKVVRVFRASDPGHAVVYQKDEIAEAEPALPGWTMSLKKLFE
jgi:Uma2 family endonuclease